VQRKVLPLSDGSETSPLRIVFDLDDRRALRSFVMFVLHHVHHHHHPVAAGRVELRAQ
jgi:hypothetical protein